MNAPLSPEAARMMADLESGRVPGPSEAPPAATGGSLDWPQLTQITLCALGLTPSERSQLDHLVALSTQRRPRIETLPVGRAHEADVILLNADDPEARAWSERQDWLDGRAVLWLGRTPALPGHAELHRPIQWPMLPIVLARALHTRPARPSELVARPAQPQTAAVLVLSGEPTRRARLRWLIEATGRRVTATASAREGLAALHAASYDCVVLADGVPDLESAAVCRRVHALERRIGRIPVLLMEEDPGAWSRMWARLAGFEAVVTLPPDERAMAQLLERHHAEPRPVRDLAPAEDPPTTQMP